MIATSPDGQWAAVCRGREVSLLANAAGPATSHIEIESDDADLMIIGPPSVLAVVTRGTAPGGASLNRMVLYMPPYLDAVARLDLEVPMRIAAVTGPRIVLVSTDGKAVTVVRVAGRALSSQSLDPGSPVEFAVGLDRNQVLFSLLRKLEAWDAVSGRPLLRMQIQLPPPPRIVGAAHGHLWARRPGGEEILVCRLSDMRPFLHHAGAPIDEVVCHPASPLLVLATRRGLVRLHCFAHSLTVIDAPWQPGMALAQLVVGDDVSLIGMSDEDDEPWRVPIAGAGAPTITHESPEGMTEPAIAPEKPRTGGLVISMGPMMTTPTVSAPVEPVERTERGERSERIEAGGRADRGDASGHGESIERTERTERTESVERPASIQRVELRSTSSSGVPMLRLGDTVRNRAWRDPLPAYGAELARGGEAELPTVGGDTELGQLAQRLALSTGARRALVALYALYLVGEAGVAIARLAHGLGDWTEPLGQGELGALAMLRRRGGKVGLRRAVTELLDGVSPRAVRLVGASSLRPRSGALRLARDGKANDAIEAELAAQLGRIAVIEGGAAAALLEARLYAATAVALAPPIVRPLPWPRDAGMIVVVDGAAPAWVAALPGFTDA
jgi:hypothetical protein